MIKGTKNDCHARYSYKGARLAPCDSVVGNGRSAQADGLSGVGF